MIELRGALRYSDILRFQYFHTLRKSAWALGVLFLFLGFEWIAPVLLTNWPEGGLRVALLLCGIMAAVIGITPYRTARQLWTKQPSLAEEGVIRFSNEGLSGESPSVTWTYKWPMIRSVQQTGTAYLLYQSPQAALIVPKRAFVDSAAEEDWLRQIPASIPIHPVSLIGRWF